MYRKKTNFTNISYLLHHRYELLQFIMSVSSLLRKIIFVFVLKILFNTKTFKMLNIFVTTL